MDPSYNNSNSGDGSGGMNPNGAMQPVAPAGPVVSEQPITPVQPVAPVQPVMPGQLPSALEQPVVSEQSVMPVQSVSPMQPAQRINPITHRPMDPVAGGVVMNQMPGQMMSPMMGDAVPNQNMMQPMSSGASGDIVLAGAEKKKPKLGAIILVVALIVLAVGILFWQIGMMSGRSANKFSIDLVNDYSDFVSYMYFGEQSNDALSTIDSGDVFQFERMLYSKDTGRRKEFFTIAKELLDKIKSSLGGEDDLGDEALTAFNKMMECAAFVIDIGSVPVLSGDELIELYLGSESLMDANERVEVIYSSLTSSDVGEISQYGKDVITVSYGLLTQIDALKAAGCINDNGVIDQQCVKSIDQNHIKQSDDKMDEALVRIEGMKETIDSMRSTLVGEILIVNSILKEI